MVSLKRSPVKKTEEVMSIHRLYKMQSMSGKKENAQDWLALGVQAIVMRYPLKVV